MKHLITYLFIITMAFSTVSCGKRPELNGEWKITSVDSETVTLSEASPSLTFNSETGRIHGYTGVNIVNGEYVQEGRRLSLQGLGVTMMAGPEEDMDLESKILDAFENIHSAKLSDKDSLEFYNKDGEIIMTLSKKNTKL